MLQITVPSGEYWDEIKEEFVSTKGQTLQLEHSLVSISKWEAKWCKAFLGKEPKTAEQTMDYIRCMTITQNVDPAIYGNLTPENYRQINEYIEAPMTATHFSTDSRTSGRTKDTITAELIYYWMIAFNIPVEFQKWHLNRLLTLIRVCDIKNSPQKKMGKRELMQKNSALNAARRARMNSKG